MLSIFWRRAEASIIAKWTQVLAWSPLRRAFMITLLAVAVMCFATSSWIGGDAFQGRAEAGRFFVRAHPNSPEHEVSRSVFLLSFWEMRAFFALWAIGLVAPLLDRLWVAAKR